ncbi:hypothetical protein N9V13_06500 [Betaproteobacteria bacterium]|nr:hypothetical protein [Betaproteobacteria bacterium]
MILINTRPMWNLGRNIWNQELRRNLNPCVTLLSAPSQEISLYAERKTGTLLMKRQIQSLLSCKVKKKIILFTSPTSVEAFFKIFRRRSYLAGCYNSLHGKKELVKKAESFFYMQRNKISLGAIGEGTARRFRELFVSPLNEREYLGRNNLKMLYLEKEATGQRWVEEFSEKIRPSFVVVIEGKENSVALVQRIKLYSSRVLSFRIYKRKNLIDRSTSLSLANKISLITKSSSDSVIKKQPVGILVSSTSAINSVRYLIESLQESERLIAISHHDKILSQVKKIHGRISCRRVESLSPAYISEEINKLL